MEYVRDIPEGWCKVKSHRNEGKNKRVVKELDQVEHGIDNDSQSDGSNVNVNDKNFVSNSG